MWDCVSKVIKVPRPFEQMEAVPLPIGRWVVGGRTKVTFENFHLENST
jgi:hypothetical protein